MPQTDYLKFMSAARLMIAAMVVGCSTTRHQSARITAADTIVVAITQPALSEVARLSLGESPLLTVAAPSASHGKIRVTASVADQASPVVTQVWALDWTTGDTLARGHGQHATAVGALGTALSELRVALGEPADTVRKYSTPLSRATSPSPAALDAWADGMAALRRDGAVASVPPFARAVALDSGFVPAIFDLGLAYRNSGQESLARDAWTRAFARRQRADAYTAFNVAASYYSFVTADSGLAVNAYRAWSRAYPRDFRAVSGLGSFYGDISLFDQGIAQFTTARGMNPGNVIIREDLIELLTATSAFDRAAAEYDAMRRLGLDDDAPHINMYAVRFLTHDSAAMAQEAAWFDDKPALQHEILGEEADVAAYAGHLVRARALTDKAVESAVRAGNVEEAAAWALNAAWREDLFGYPAKARVLAARALALAPQSREGTSVAAIVLARTGDTVRARAILTDLGRRYPDHAVEQAYWLPCIRAQIALAARDPREALAQLRGAARYDAMIPQVAYYSLMPSVVLRAEAYAALGQRTEAANQWAIVVREPGIAQMSATAAVARMQLARLRAP